VHVVVLLTVVHAFGGVAPLPVLLAAIVPLSLAMAELFYRLVERPAMRLAARAAAGWQRKPRPHLSNFLPVGSRLAPDKGSA